MEPAANTLILTIPKMDSYDLPSGLIKKDKNGKYAIKYNSQLLKMIENPLALDFKIGMPEGFYIKNDKIVLYPTPQEKGIVTVDYFTF